MSDLFKKFRVAFPLSDDRGVDNNKLWRDSVEKWLHGVDEFLIDETEKSAIFYAIRSKSGKFFRWLDCDFVNDMEPACLFRDNPLSIQEKFDSDADVVSYNIVEKRSVKPVEELVVPDGAYTIVIPPWTTISNAAELAVFTSKTLGCDAYFEFNSCVFVAKIGDSSGDVITQWEKRTGRRKT